LGRITFSAAESFLSRTGAQMNRPKIILTAVWWVWGLLLFLLLIALSQRSALFGDSVSAVWEWFLPHVLPTLSLVGVTAYATPPDKAQAEAPSPMPFFLALAASCVHLAALSLALLGTQSSVAPLEHLRTANLWLAPLQALATSSLAVFFIRRTA
jgi:hypothetical protein